MKGTKVVALLSVFLQSAAGLPTDPDKGGAGEACKQVWEAAQKYMKDNNIVPKNLTEFGVWAIPAVPPVPVPPSLALACLKSVPLDKERSLANVEFLKPILEWHSTVDYLRDPPKGYLSEGVDLIRGLDDIAEKVKKSGRGGYKNQYEYLVDLYDLTNIRPRDFHLTYSTLLWSLFTFKIGVDFVAISKDGVAPPEIYLKEDVNYDKHGYKPSPVSTVDGIPAVEFLERAAVRRGNSHDPDARFNSLLKSVSRDAHGDPFPGTVLDLGVVHRPGHELGDTSTVKFRNGTKRVFPNAAYLLANLTDIATGADLYAAFGPGGSTGPIVFPWHIHTIHLRNHTGDFSAYPTPIEATDTKKVSGFLLSDEDGILSDTAILSVQSFTSYDDPYDLNTLPLEEALEIFFGRTLQWQNTVINTLKSAVAANRTKLILDLQGNPGGDAGLLGLLYLTLFPPAPGPPWRLPIYWQLRAHPQLAFLGAYEEERLRRENQSYETPWPHAGLLTTDGGNFTSFEDFYGPIPDPTGRGEYTRPGQWQEGWLEPWGYQLYNTSYNFTPPFSSPPFDPENILILTDGLCGSACAIFTTVLRHIHSVRALALGGRPRDGAMQAVGQTNGGPAVNFFGTPTINETETPIPEGLQLFPSWEEPSPLRVAHPYEPFLGWGPDTGVNAANIVPANEPGAAEGTAAPPMQFRYEAANCRLFVTWDMARNITAVWRAAAKAAWGEGKCVKGSSTGKGGRIGDAWPEYRKEVEDRYGLGDGPGALRKR